MKKKVIAVLSMLLLCSSFFAKEVKEISDDRAIILVNYLQYSLAQIKEHSDNKIVANHEFDLIINNINASALKDPDIIDAYTSMLKSLTSLKLTANEKKHAELLAARERDNAIYNIFNSAGSVFIPGQNPLLSIAYASLNAGLNYAGAVKQASDRKEDSEFQIAQDLLIAVDDARIDLHDKTARSFSYREDTDLLISETLMESFVKALTIDSTDVREHNLKNLAYSFEKFPPYWFALGYTQHKNGKYEKALESYSKYDLILNNEMILNYDEISSQVYLSLLDIYIKLGKEQYKSEIDTYIKKIESQIKKAPTESQKQLIYSLGCVYKMIGDETNASAQFVSLRKFGDDNWVKTSKTLDDILSGNLTEILNGNINEDLILKEEAKATIPRSVKMIILVLTILSIIYTLYCSRWLIDGFHIFETENDFLNRLGFYSLYVCPYLVAKITILLRVILVILVFTIPLQLNFIMFVALGINIILMITFLISNADLKYLLGGYFFIFVMILLNIVEIVLYYVGILNFS